MGQQLSTNSISDEMFPSFNQVCLKRLNNVVTMLVQRCEVELTF